MPRISALAPATRAAGENEIPQHNVESANTQKITVEMIMPTGSILDYAGASAPAGWLFCYGQTLDANANADYQALYDAIGNVYGGTDHTNFKVPDLRGRVVAGQDDMGGTSANRLTDQSGGVDGDVLGDTGGEETHALTSGENGAHTHGVGSYNVRANVGNTANGQTNLDDWAGSAGPLSASNVQVGTGVTGTSGSSGSGTPHNNIQPTIILNKIIKY